MKTETELRIMEKVLTNLLLNAKDETEIILINGRLDIIKWCLD